MDISRKHTLASNVPSNRTHRRKLLVSNVSTDSYHQYPDVHVFVAAKVQHRQNKSTQHSIVNQNLDSTLKHKTNIADMPRTRQLVTQVGSNQEKPRVIDNDLSSQQSKNQKKTKSFSQPSLVTVKKQPPEIHQTQSENKHFSSSKQIPKKQSCSRLCCPCSLIRVFFSILACLLLCTAIAAIVIAVIKKPEMTHSSVYTQIIRAGDVIIGLYDTTAGQSTGGFNGSFSGSSEFPSKAIDGLTGTKYLNFGTNSSSLPIYGFGVNTGFIVIPTLSNSSVACSLRFATASDAPERDPITVTLEGSKLTSIATLQLGSSWTLLYNGSTGISPTNDPGRRTYLPEQKFSNTVAYASYRLLITSKRNTSNSVQYSEVQMMGYI